MLTDTEGGEARGVYEFNLDAPDYLDIICDEASLTRGTIEEDRSADGEGTVYFVWTALADKFEGRDPEDTGSACYEGSPALELREVE